MKNAIFLISLFILSLTGCSSDDDGRSYHNNSLNGRWYLEAASCFCGFPEDPKFYENELRFDTSTSEVKVTMGSVTGFIDSGSYTYERKTDSTLSINEVNYSYEIDRNGKLILFSDPFPGMVDDEVTLIYVRNEDFQRF